MGWVGRGVERLRGEGVAEGYGRGGDGREGEEKRRGVRSRI